MHLPAGPEAFEFTQNLIHTRQNVSPKRLLEPGPSPQQLQAILGAAAAAPDHGQLLPWRFVVVPQDQRGRLAEAFGQALLERDPEATPAQIEGAHEKAYRAPVLVLAVARLTHDEVHSSTLGRGAQHPQASASEISDAERLVSLGCAIQNILLCAHAAGFGAGLTSGQAMASPHLRALFALQNNEQAVCCINIGTATQRKPPRVRPKVGAYVSSI